VKLICVILVNDVQIWLKNVEKHKTDLLIIDDEEHYPHRPRPRLAHRWSRRPDRSCGHRPFLQPHRLHALFPEERCFPEHPQRFGLAWFLNFLAFAETRNDHGTALGLGYVFKNVAAGIDATVSVSSDNEWSSNGSIYSLGLRRSLSEVVPGLEVAISYSKQSTIPSSPENRVLSYELAYNINKQYTVAYGIQDIRKGLLNSSSEKIQNVSVRYNF
jgi:hypothetical protein